MNKIAKFLVLLLFSPLTCASESIEDLFVFVGEKISVTEAPKEPAKPCQNKDGSECITISMDLKYIAKYRVVEMVHGVSPGAEVSFDVYDHYGEPNFAGYKYVLLFVSNFNGKLVHQKKQYFDVYRTRGGKWATCGDPNNYNSEGVKPAKLLNVAFEPSVYFDITHFSTEYIDREFPMPIWQRQGNKVICQNGVYIDELFRITNEGVLKSRRESDEES